MKHLLVLLLLLIGGCTSLPRDTNNWSERVRSSHILEVGVVRVPGTEHKLTVSSQEVKLIQALADKLGAKVRWREGNLFELMHLLEEREIPVVAAQIRIDSPYASIVGLSRPYGTVDNVQRCIAIAPGQNRLLLTLDKILANSEKSGGGKS